MKALLVAVLEPQADQLGQPGRNDNQRVHCGAQLKPKARFAAPRFVTDLRPQTLRANRLSSMPSVSFEGLPCNRLFGRSIPRLHRVEVRAMAEQVGISVELLHVPNAHPPIVIIETAQSRGCDLIVMASHRHRGIRMLFLRSQTSGVLVNRSVPVL
jgi:hypothetical protein